MTPTSCGYTLTGWAVFQEGNNVALLMLSLTSCSSLLLRVQPPNL